MNKKLKKQIENKLEKLQALLDQINQARAEALLLLNEIEVEICSLLKNYV